jgi:sugar lactone lactonase YvrE
MQPRVLLDGLAMPESPRWHDGRLWFSNWGTRQIVAVDLDGNSEVFGRAPMVSVGQRTGSQTDACSSQARS